MIVFYLGLPGSGKSYAGVDKIYNNFSKEPDAKRDLKKDYINCYTNINEFKFDLLDNVYKFDADEFYKQLKELHSMYKKKASDAELIEKAKEFNIYKSLFVLDEAHNFLDVPDPIKIWWLTYHRHLYHDVILITQSLSLIHSKYKPLAEAFYKAKSSSLTLNKSYFNYMYYTESRLTKASYVSTVKVKKNPKVFELYHSGDSVDSKNVIKRFIFIALLFLMLLFFLGYLFYADKSKEIQEAKSVQQPKSMQQHIAQKVVNEKSESTPGDPLEVGGRTYLEFHCMAKCVDNKYHTVLSPFVLRKFIKSELVTVYFKENVTKSYIVYYTGVSDELIEF